MRKVCYAAAATLVALTMSNAPAFAQGDQSGANVTQSDTRCVERDGFKGRWYQAVDSKWKRCRSTAGGFWVPAGSGAFFGASGGVLGGVGLAAAAALGATALGDDDGPSSP